MREARTQMSDIHHFSRRYQMSVRFCVWGVGGYFTVSVDSVYSFWPRVPAGSPSRGGDATVYVCDINQPSLLTPLYSVLVSISLFMALSTAFHPIFNSPDNFPFSHSVLPVLSLPYWYFNLCVSL